MARCCRPFFRHRCQMTANTCPGRKRYCRAARVLEPALLSVTGVPKHRRSTANPNSSHATNSVKGIGGKAILAFLQTSGVQGGGSARESGGAFIDTPCWDLSSAAGFRNVSGPVVSALTASARCRCSVVSPTRATGNTHGFDGAGALTAHRAFAVPSIPSCEHKAHRLSVFIPPMSVQYFLALD